MCLKALTGGEDAYFVSNHSGGVIAVADGVSGYGSVVTDILLINSSFFFPH